MRYSVAFDPDAFVDVAIAALRDSGVRLRMHTWFAGVGLDGAIAAVLVESKKGREAILPRVVVDATGDGDVFVAAGADYEQVTIPPHLWFRVGGVDGRPQGFVFDTVDAGRVLVPWGPHAERVDPCDPDDLTRAELACREGAAALRGSAGVGSRVRRARGSTTTRACWASPRAGDWSAITCSPRRKATSRSPTRSRRTGHWTKRGVVYEIPYRCLTTPAADEPARCRPLHLDDALRAPGDEGDPRGDGDRRSRGHRRRDRRRGRLGAAASTSTKSGPPCEPPAPTSARELLAFSVRPATARTRRRRSARRAPRPPPARRARRSAVP